MADSNLKIVVTAEDNASGALSKIKKSFDDYQQSYETMSQYTNRQKQEANALSHANDDLAASTDGVNKSSKGLFATFTAASLAATAITKAISFASSQFKESVDAANAYQSALAGLSSYANAMGSSTEQATEAVKSLSSDGLLPTVNAANALKNLLASGLNLEQASSLIKTFEDRAAFGRNQTIGFGDAVENLSQAFKTEQSQAGDANGMTENFTQILKVGAKQMGKNVDQLTELERAHAKLIGIQQLSIATQGNAAEYAETAAGQQAKLAYEVNQTQIAFGTALQPAIQQIQQAMVNLGQSFDLAGDGMKTTQMFLSTLAFAFINLGNVVVGVAQAIVGAIQSIASGSLKPLEEAIKGSYARIATGAINYENQMQKIAAGTADTRVTQAQRAYDQISDSAAKAASKMAQQIDRENRSFADSMAQRAASFKQSMTDMIISHRDKARSIQSDIKSENAAYAEQVADRKEQLGDQLIGLEEAHQDKVADITQKITEEKNSGLIVDGVLFRQANQKKLDDLQRQLDKETTAYQQSVDKAQAKYDKDVANDAKRHTDKINNLQIALNTETAILQKHATEVAAVGEKQKEDDISRLQRTFDEENVRSQAQHQQRLVDIRQQGTAQGIAYGTSLANAQKDVLAAKTPEIQAVAKEQGKQMSDSMWAGFKERATEFFNGLPKWIDQKTGALTGLKTLVKAPGDLAVAGLNFLTKALLGFADGTNFAPGGLALVGERGPELDNLPRGSQVFTNTQSKQMMQGSSPNITIGTVINNTKADWGSFARDIGFELALRT